MSDAKLRPHVLQQYFWKEVRKLPHNDKIRAVNKHHHLWSLPWPWRPTVRPSFLIFLIKQYCIRVYKYKFYSSCWSNDMHLSFYMFLGADSDIPCATFKHSHGIVFCCLDPTGPPASTGELLGGATLLGKFGDIHVVEARWRRDLMQECILLRACTKQYKTIQNNICSWWKKAAVKYVQGVLKACTKDEGKNAERVQCSIM